MSILAYTTPTTLLYRLGCLLAALLYASVLTALPMEPLMDRDNYLEMASFAPVILLRYLSNSILAVFTNEPVWLLLNAFFSLFLSAESVVRLVVFFSSFTVSYIVLKSNPKNFIWLLIVLLMPNVIKNFIIHLRQGLAIAFFLIGWFSYNRNKKLFFIGITPFIHSSFFIVLALLFFTKLVKALRFSHDLRFISYTLLGVAFGLAVAIISTVLGARQATSGTISEDTGISGLAFIFWLIIIAIYVMQGKKFMYDHSFSFAAIFFYLATYFLTAVTGRVFESSIILVLISGCYLTSWRKVAFIALIVIFSLFTFYSNADKPFLGYGITA